MISLHEKMKDGLQGEIFFKVYDSDDNIIYEGHQGNLVVDNGLLVTAGLLASNFDDYAITQLTNIFVSFK